jgi:hypothetical protein
VGNACVINSVATCSDGIQNQGETGIDCGGPCPACSTYLRTFYISNSGNDGNDGRTPTTAWRTISKVNSYSFLPGDGILFNRGDTWREQIVPEQGSSANYITYGAYGTGNKPLILGSVTANTGWTNVGGNIWQNSNSAFTVDVANLIFNNGASHGVKIMSDTPTLDAQGEFWYDHVNHRIRMYSTSNPATFYSSIECALSNDALYENHAEYIIFQDLDFRYWGKCVTQGTGNYVTYRRLSISYIGGADSASNGNPTWYYERFGNGIQIWEGRHDVTIEECTIDNVYDAGISPQGYAGGFEVYNLFIRNNIITNCEYGFEFYERDSSASAHDIYFENNVIAKTGGGFGHNQRPDGVMGRAVRLASFTASKNNIFIRNNIFYSSTEHLFYTHYLSDLNNIDLDYNLYYQPAGSGIIATASDQGMSYTTLAQWKTATGQEAHAVGSNPLFVDVANGDFHLQSGSPAIDAGVDVGLDYNGNHPDLGAYETNY